MSKIKLHSTPCQPTATADSSGIGGTRYGAHTWPCGVDFSGPVPSVKCSCSRNSWRCGSDNLLINQGPLAVTVQGQVFNVESDTFAETDGVFRNTNENRPTCCVPNSPRRPPASALRSKVTIVARDTPQQVRICHVGFRCKRLRL